MLKQQAPVGAEVVVVLVVVLLVVSHLKYKLCAGKHGPLASGQGHPTSQVSELLTQTPAQQK